ncbi:hypothetical protein DSECCO2_616640 [anaerobic digester metagenome]
MKQGLKVNKKTLCYIPLLFVWIPAYSIYSILPMANRLMLMLRLVCSVGIIIRFLKLKMRTEYLIILGFFLVETFSTLQHNAGNIFNAVEFCLCVMSMFLFFINLDDYRMIRFRQATVILSFVYVVGLTFTCFTTPSAIRENLGLHFFISSRANSAQAMVCLLSIIFALDYKIYNEIRRGSLFILGLTVIDMLGLHSGQGMIMIGIVILTLIVFTQKKSGRLLKVFSPTGVGLVNIVLNWLIISQSYMNIAPLTYFITEVLHKEVTLTGRDIIYTNIVSIYLRSPLIGFGYGNSVVEETLSHFAAGYNSAHNSLFQLLIEVGIVGFIFFLILVFYILSRLRKVENNYCYILYGGIVAFLIGGTTSLAYYNVYFYILIAFSVGMYTNAQIINSAERSVL